MALVLTALAACDNNEKKTDDAPLIGKQTPVIENGLLTPEVLWAFGRIGGVQVSPDETKILYTVSYYSVEQNKSNSEIFVMNVDGTDRKQITATPHRQPNG